MLRRTFGQSLVLALLLGLVVTLVCPVISMACDTPVYRYAMYKWQPAPYELYLFHEGELTADQQAVSEAIDVLNNDVKRPSNLLFYSVDTSEEKALDSVPADVRDQFKATADQTVPRYMLFSPQGLKVYAGPITPADVAAMSDSVGRRKIIEQITSGDACVLVLLSGISKSGEGVDAIESVNRETTDAAVKIVLKLVNDINAGKTELYSAPPKKLQPGQQPHTEEAAVGHTVSMLEIDRTDPTEKWLVRMLMATESDLYEFDSPMVFPVYGRGRALPAFLDKGINADTITDYAVSFLTGACSCTVKEQNPGIDLLMRHDWDTSAEKVAARFGAEEGNEFKFETEDFFPNLLIPTSDSDVIAPPKSTDVSATNDPESVGSDPPAEPLTTPKTQVADSGNADSGNAEPSEDPRRTGESPPPNLTESVQNEPPADQVAIAKSSPNSTTANSGQARESGSISSVVIIGTGVGVALLLLMAATFFISRGSGI